MIRDMSQKDVILVYMPVTWLHPSLALGLLKADLNQSGVDNEVIYASHHFIDFLGEEYFQEIEELRDLFYGVWEMLFAQFTDFRPMVPAKEMIRALTERLVFPAEHAAERLLEEWDTLSDRASAFLDMETDNILKKNPKIVACSILTQQRNAALSLFKRIKERRPEVITILGGGRCSEKSGPMILQGSPSLDFCFSGDGDHALGDGCRMLLEGDFAGFRKKHPEFLMRGDAPVDRVFSDLDACLIPDFTEYFEQVKKNSFGTSREHSLVAEGSRGCWWGQKGGCRFCGLHACEEAIRYRKKSPDRLFRELMELSERYGVRQFFLADMILDMELIRSLPEEAPDERKHLQLFAECKSNLRPEQLLRMKKNGFVLLQPGIESLSDELLDLMHKGAKTIHQLAFLKYTRQFQIQCYWNIMFGFPTEQAAWYDEMLELMKHLHFLQPPTSISYMQLARNSVFWKEHEKYGLKTIRPTLIELACCPDEDYASAVTDFFESPELVRIPGLMERLQEAVIQWRTDFARGSRLELMHLEDRDVIRDLRIPGTKKVYHLTGLKRALYAAAYEIVSEKEIFRRLKGEEGEYSSEQEIEEAIVFFTQRYMMFRKGGRLLSLAIPD